MKRFNTLECFAMAWPQHISLILVVLCIQLQYIIACYESYCDIVSSSCFSVLIQDDDDGRRVYGAGGRVGARRITRPSLGKTTAKGKEESLLFIYCIVHILRESRDIWLKPFFSYWMRNHGRMESHIEIQSRNRVSLIEWVIFYFLNFSFFPEP